MSKTSGVYSFTVYNLLNANSIQGVFNIYVDRDRSVTKNLQGGTEVPIPKVYVDKKKNST